MDSDEGKLALRAGYTIASTTCVGLVTNAKKSEVFASCAAYSAVLVVFVSGDLDRRKDSNGSEDYSNWAKCVNYALPSFLVTQ